MINKSLKITTMMVLAMIIIIATTIEARAVSLRNNVVLTDDNIRLGDLFHGLDMNADKVLGPAPQPGREMTLNARTLMRVAIAMDLPWRPSSSAEYVTLSRAATVLSHYQIEDALKAALAEEGLDTKFDITPSGAWPRIVLPQEEMGSVEVTSLNYDPTKDWFQAVLVAPSSKNPIQTASISGRIQHLIEVPVLDATLKNGTVIGKRDIKYVSINRRDLQHDTVMTEDELIGMTPRRIVLNGKPVLSQEIVPPRVISRGDTVTMIFQEGALQLTAQAKALEHGSHGDVIRVVNTNSNKTIDAMVSGEKEVRVQAF